MGSRSLEAGAEWAGPTATKNTPPHSKIVSVRTIVLPLHNDIFSTAAVVEAPSIPRLQILRQTNAGLVYQGEFYIENIGASDATLESRPGTRMVADRFFENPSQQPS